MAEDLPAHCWRRSPSIRREISEETGGEADIPSLLQVLDSGAGTERQYFYLGRIASWDFAHAPDRSSASRGAVRSVTQLSRGR